MLLIALAASCASHTGADLSCSGVREHSSQPEPAPVLSLLSCTTDAHGVRHYELSDGSAIALDPLEPFTSDRQRDFPDTHEIR